VRDDPAVVALVTRARDGDPTAWNQIVERYASLVWSTCRRYGLNAADIDDIGGSVWLKLVESLDTLREPAALPGWLATTTQRACLKLLQTNSRQVPVDDRDNAAGKESAADESLLIEDRRIALRAAFSDLSQRCQQLLSLLFADPPTGYAAISTSLKMPIGAIGPTRTRCLQRLRRTGAMTAWVDGVEKATLS
jgi:RNA polymerase sigma factor (sigma-70 family)